MAKFFEGKKRARHKISKKGIMIQLSQARLLFVDREFREFKEFRTLPAILASSGFLRIRY